MKRNSYQGPKIWNTINADIKNKKSFLSFKAALRKKSLKILLDQCSGKFLRGINSNMR